MDLLLAGFPFKGWDGYVTLPESWHGATDVVLSWSNFRSVQIMKRSDIEPINWQRDGAMYDIRPITADGTIWLPPNPWRSHFANNATIVVVKNNRSRPPCLIIREAFPYEKTAILG